MVTYDLIANILAEEAESLVEHIPRGVGDLNARGKKSPESSVKRTCGEIFNVFDPNWSKISDR